MRKLTMLVALLAVGALAIATAVAFGEKKLSCFGVATSQSRFGLHAFVEPPASTPVAAPISVEPQHDTTPASTPHACE